MVVFSVLLNNGLQELQGLLVLGLASTAGFAQLFSP